jgi:hypothetical protein
MFAAHATPLCKFQVHRLQIGRIVSALACERQERSLYVGAEYRRAGRARGFFYGVQEVRVALGGPGDGGG